MTDDFKDFLFMRYCRAAAYQDGQGNSFQISFEQYIALHTKSQLSKLAAHFKEGTIEGFIRSKQWGYVLGWVSRAAKLEKVCTPDTMKIMTRTASIASCRLRKGDSHTPESRARISQKKKGKKQTRAHVEKRAAAQRGVKRGPLSEETKAKIRAAKAARKGESK